MQAYYFIYTRIHSEDYQAMYFPSNEQCPRKEIFSKFMESARGVINTDNYYLDLSKPTWILSQLGEYTLWGIGILNELLNPEFCYDRVGCPIRGFFGIIFRGHPNVLPYDINFYKDIYNRLIVPNWYEDAQHCFHEGVLCDFDFSTYSSITAANYGINLNLKSNKSVILGNVDEKEAIAQVLYTPNASIAIGLQSKEHAFSERYKFPNILMKGFARTEFVYTSNQETEQLRESALRNSNPWEEQNERSDFHFLTSEFNDDRIFNKKDKARKKVQGSRLKKIAVTVVATIAIVLWIKNCH